MSKSDFDFMSFLSSAIDANKKKDGLTIERRVEIQYEIICQMKKTIDKLTSNNNKIIAEVKRLGSVVRNIEASR